MLNFSFSYFKYQWLHLSTFKRSVSLDVIKTCSKYNKFVYRTIFKTRLDKWNSVYRSFQIYVSKFYDWNLRYYTYEKITSQKARKRILSTWRTTKIAWCTEQNWRVSGNAYAIISFHLFFKEIFSNQKFTFVWTSLALLLGYVLSNISIHL